MINTAYLDRVARWTGLMEEEGIYDARIFIRMPGADPGGPRWPGLHSPAQPAFGWDGAPGWATLDDGQPRCFTSNREINPAVRAAWTNFFDDKPALGRGRDPDPLRADAKAGSEAVREGPGVAGIDIMNEPNAFGPVQTEQLGRFYGRSLKSIRAGEKAGGGFRHPSLRTGVLWSLLSSGAPAPLTSTRTSSIRPISTGSIGATGPPSRESFENARRGGGLRRRPGTDR